ncbi:MAG: sugar O-acetyltransferase [Planctomycetes bacterium]|nr:sugar O-acetyltransferase [Planctomycetota bacterium]
MMDDKAKMLAGSLYRASGAGLPAERLAAKTLCQEYNVLHPARLPHEGMDLLRRLFGRLGDNGEICQPFYCDYGYNIEVGNNFYANHHCVILDPARVVFGDNVMIGPNCGFYTAGHPLVAAERTALWEFAHPIRVGDDVWFGGNVVVLPGVSVGSGTVVGAGSVVTKSLPAGVLAAGNPCRVLREVTAADRMLPDWC